MNTILTPQHYSSLITREVREICAPLKQYGITHFLYARFFKDNTCYVLTHNWEAFSHHYQKKYQVAPAVSNIYSRERFYYLPALDTNGYNKISLEWRDLFNIDYPIHSLEKHENYNDFFSFASTSNNPGVINFYLNNIDFLEKFKFYFKDKARALIKNSNQNKIIVPGEMLAEMKNGLNNNSLNFDKNILRNQLSPKHYAISVKNKEISITKRELDIIRELARGATAKETGKILNISPRSVESYLRNLRNKLSIHNKIDIIALLKNVNLLY